MEHTSYQNLLLEIGNLIEVIKEGRDLVTNQHHLWGMTDLYQGEIKGQVVDAPFLSEIQDAFQFAEHLSLAGVGMASLVGGV